MTVSVVKSAQTGWEVTVYMEQHYIIICYYHNYLLFSMVQTHPYLALV